MKERTPNEIVDLERRAQPQQKRSAARIDNIVAATQRLLDQVGAESITTSAVAQEAGVPVSSVYRYFPNIYAIYRTIFEKFKAETDQIILSELANMSTNWRESLPIMIGGLRSLLQSNPSYGAVFRLALTTQELSSVREEWNERLAAHLAQRWRMGEDGFEGGDPDLVARMCVEIYCAAEILIVQHADAPKKQEALFNEAMIALERYLSKYLT
ncbi:MAG: TetR/AcrR family transcriptional regulator [Pseudomonadota bacterium]